MAGGPSRKQARRDAVFLLYQTEVTQLSMAELVEGQRLREGYAPDDFTVRAVAGVLKDRRDIDEVLEEHARDWPLDRIAPLERSILRLAVWEITTGVTPHEVAIDEAVRLTKRYSTDEAGAFVNGVLGGVVRPAGEEAGDDAPADDVREGDGAPAEDDVRAGDGAPDDRAVAAGHGDVPADEAVPAAGHHDPAGHAVPADGDAGPSVRTAAAGDDGAPDDGGPAPGPGPGEDEDG